MPKVTDVEFQRASGTRFFENYWKLCCLSVFLLCAVFTVKAMPAEEIIFVSSAQNQMGIWISDVNGRNARKLFDPPVVIQEISVQAGDRYILCVGEGIDIENGFDAYLFDTQKLNKGRKDLTWGRFSFVSDAAISFSGDVVFANTIFNEFPDGIYLIPKHEVHEPIPKAEKLFDGAAGYVDWSPNGQEVVFSNSEGIFLLDITTKQVSQILEYGYRPVFSPNGKKLAFTIYTPPGENGRKGYNTIGVVPLHAAENVQIFERTETYLHLDYLTWTPDGMSIAYVLTEFTFGVPGGVGWFGIVREYSNFAVSVENGRLRRMFEDIEGGVRVWEWTRDSFPLTPIAKFTTTWGELKREKESGGYHE